MPIYGSTALGGQYDKGTASDQINQANADRMLRMTLANMQQAQSREAMRAQERMFGDQLGFSREELGARTGMFDKGLGFQREALAGELGDRAAGRNLEWDKLQSSQKHDLARMSAADQLEASRAKRNWELEKEKMDYTNPGAAFDRILWNKIIEKFGGNTAAAKEAIVRGEVPNPVQPQPQQTPKPKVYSGSQSAPGTGKLVSPDGITYEFGEKPQEQQDGGVFKFDPAEVRRNADAIASEQPLTQAQVEGWGKSPAKNQGGMFGNIDLDELIRARMGMPASPAQRIAAAQGDREVELAKNPSLPRQEYIQKLTEARTQIAPTLTALKSSISSNSWVSNSDLVGYKALIKQMMQNAMSVGYDQRTVNQIKADIAASVEDAISKWTVEGSGGDDIRKMLADAFAESDLFIGE